MTDLAFPPPEPFVLPCEDGPGFPVRRIFCIGRNYAAHAAEMGAEVDRERPFYFLKAAVHAVHSGATVPFPPATEDLHHEMELAVAVGAPAFRVAPQEAMAVVWGWGAALDMTRRDLQARAKERRHPWDAGKDFAGGAVLAPLRRDWRLGDQRIRLAVNGEARQDGTVSDMVHSVPELIAHLSAEHRLEPGDLILTGTPEGVGPVRPGDRLVGEVEGLPPVILHLGEPD